MSEVDDAGLVDLAEEVVMARQELVNELAAWANPGPESNTCAFSVCAKVEALSAAIIRLHIADFLGGKVHR